MNVCEVCEWNLMYKTYLFWKYEKNDFSPLYDVIEASVRATFLADVFLYYLQHSIHSVYAMKVTTNSFHFGVTFADADFESQKTNWTQVLRNRLCGRLQIRVRSIMWSGNINISTSFLSEDTKLYKNELSGHFFFFMRFDTSMTYCPLLINTLIVILVKWIPLNLRSNSRRWATLLLPNFINSRRLWNGHHRTPLYDKWGDVKFRYTNFDSWLAIFCFCPHMSFPSHAIYHGLPFLKVLFSEGCDFYISFLRKDMSWNV